MPLLFFCFYILLALACDKVLEYKFNIAKGQGLTSKKQTKNLKSMAIILESRDRLSPNAGKAWKVKKKMDKGRQRSSDIPKGLCGICSLTANRLLI